MLCMDCLGTGRHVFTAPVDLKETQVAFSESGFPIADKKEPRNKLSWFDCVSCSGKGIIGEPLGPATIQVHNPGKMENEPKGHKKRDKWYNELGFRFPL